MLGAFTNGSLEQIANSQVDFFNAAWGFPPFTARLFQNDYTPAPGLVLADLVEANFGGYAPQELAADEWSRDNPQPPPVFARVRNAVRPVFTADVSNGYTQRVYGYYLTAPILGLLGAVRFDAPIDVEPGGSIELEVVVQIQNAIA